MHNAPVLPGGTRILGIDPGSRICGYGMVVAQNDGGALAYVECGVLTAPDDWPPERRLGEIARHLQEVVAELRPAAIAVEDVFAKVNVRSALALAQARGMALAVAGLVGLPVFSYAPALVKKTVSGSGRADKTQVARMVAGLVGLRTPPRADAADALAVAITHGHRARFGETARLVSAVIAPGGGR